MDEELLERLKAGMSVEEMSLERDFRAWGGYVVFARNKPCTAKLLFIENELSVQAHGRRDEMWYLVSGKVAVFRGPVLEDAVKTIAELQEKILLPGDLVRIPRDTAHSLLNLYEEPSLIVEVAFGEAHEDDIRRFYDMHGRTTLEGLPQGKSIRELIPLCRKYLEKNI